LTLIKTLVSIFTDDLKRNISDVRLESYKVLNLDSLKIVELLGTEQNWFKRKEVVNQSKIYDDR
jgi:acyl carrier protein